MPGTSFSHKPYTTLLSWLALATYTVPWLIVYLTYCVALLDFPYEWEPGEGSKILYAQQIVTGKPLYKSNQTFPMLGNCYPPVYPLVLAPFVALGGPHLIWGRLVSVLSILATMLLLFTITKRTTGSAFFGWIAAACFVFCAPISCWYSLARMDSLCCFFQILTAYIILYNPTKRGALLAALAAVAAVYTKQTAALIVATLGIYYLFERKWKHAAVYYITMAVTGLMILAAIDILTHGWFYKNLFAQNIQRVFFLFRYQSFFGWIIMQNPVIFILAGCGIAYNIIRRNNSMAIWIFLGGLFNALLIGANGSGMNYFFVFWAGISLLFAESISILARWLTRRLRISPPISRTVVISVLMIVHAGWYLSLTDDIFYRHTLLDFIPTKHDRTAMQRIERYIKIFEHPIFVDRFPSIAMRYGKNDYYIEPALIQELFYHKMWDIEPILEPVMNKEFSAIFLLRKSLMPRPFKEAVAQHYRLADEIPIGTFEIWRNRAILVYVPK